MRLPAGFIVLSSFVALLSGCANFDTRGDRPLPETTPAPSTQGGGYYKDDGPGDNIPANLADVPNAVPRVEPLHRGANKPYSALGKEYVPTTNAQGFRQLGMASWYGRRYHGKPTSSGEPYDMYGMTAAHPTLPIPSYVRVTNPDNGRSVVLRVNDRGPFHADRAIDLSYTAAWKLDILKQVSPVVIEALDPTAPLPAAPAMPVVENPLPPVAAAPQTDPAPVAAPMAAPEPVAPPPAKPAAAAPAPVPTIAPPTTPATPVMSKPVIQASGLFLQLGAYTNAETAVNFAKRVQQTLSVPLPDMHYLLSGTVFKLQTGPFASPAQADLAAAALKRELGIQPFKVTR
jgi:rare lipoprotein A